MKKKSLYTIVGIVAAISACGGPTLSSDAEKPPGDDTNTVDTSPEVGRAPELPDVVIPPDKNNVPPEENVCVQTAAIATPVTRPVDIIFVIDNSASMVQEIAEVSAQLNKNFAQIIRDAGVDYRVLVVSAFGQALSELTDYERDENGNLLFPSADSTSVCIAEPLGTTLT